MRNGYYYSLKEFVGFQVRVTTPKDPGEYWWRAEDRRYANYDPWADEQPSGSHLVIELRPHKVVKHTSKGVWLEGRQFVLGTATKQFAVPTQELAIKDLIARKSRHVDGCKARLHRAEEHHAAAAKVLSLLNEEPA